MLRQFVRFGTVGAVGFVVDATALFAAHTVFANYYADRIFSYLVVATCTYVLNHYYTFCNAQTPTSLGAWRRFITANLGGFAVNYSVYSATIIFLWSGPATPYIGVAFGSAAGLVVNFFASKHLVFRQ